MPQWLHCSHCHRLQSEYMVEKVGEYWFCKSISANCETKFRKAERNGKPKGPGR